MMYDGKKPKAIGKKNIYKKSLFIELIKRGHSFSHSMRSRKDQKRQIYVFNETPELIADLLDIVEIEKRNREKRIEESQDR